MPNANRVPEVNAFHVLSVDLRKARQDAGIGLATASRMLGVSETSIKSLEKSASPQLSTIARYAAMITTANRNANAEASVVEPLSLIQVVTVEATASEVAADEQIAQAS